MLSDYKHAVKALIYRDNAQILLQQRDYTPGITFQGYWTFFGGQVELGESLKEALERELLEELGCVPGIVDEEIFQWKWDGVSPAINHCLPVHCKVSGDELILNEGMALNWFSISELNDDLPVVPGIMENISQIEKFLNQIFPTR